MADTTSATVTGISPAKGPLAGGTPVTISGKGLAGATMVEFNGVGAKVTAASVTQVFAMTPAGTKAGSVDVRVNLPTGLTPVSPMAIFTYTAPAVTKMQPDSGLAGTQVMILGSGLAGATAVLFGKVAAKPEVVIDAQITVTAPAQSEAGKVAVTINFPTGDVAAGTFDYLGPPR